MTKEEEEEEFYNSKGQDKPKAATDTTPEENTLPNTWGLGNYNNVVIGGK